MGVSVTVHRDLVVAWDDLRRVRHRRVVEEDARLAVLVALVAEGVLDAHVVAGGGAGEDVRAHRHRRRAEKLNVVVREDDVLPALAAVDGEAGVLVVAALDRTDAELADLRGLRAVKS